MQARLQKRMLDLELERQISPLPPVAVGGSLIVPIGLLDQDSFLPPAQPMICPSDAASAAEARKQMELIAMQMVMAAEKTVGERAEGRER